MTDLLEHVLVPVAHEDDARVTVRSLAPHDPGRVTALHVVEKGGGVPDKTPVEQSEELAEAAFAVVHETFPDAATETAYSSDVVDAIFDVASELDATAVAFHARPGGRLARLVSGDLTIRLVTENSLPVVSLPDPAEDGT